MFAVIYRWRVKPEKEQQFIEAWTEITKYYLTTFGALGSRLHRGSDGIFYAYAQWKCAENRTEAFQNAPKFEAGIKSYYKKSDSLESVRGADTMSAKHMEIIGIAEGKKTATLLKLQKEYDSLEVELKK